MATRIRKRLKYIGGRRRPRIKLLAHCARAQCTEPNLGSYLQVFGIDRICLYMSYTPETLPEHAQGQILPEDLDVFNKKMTFHLNWCRKCLIDCLAYLDFIKKADYIPVKVAAAALRSVMDQEIVSAEQAASLADRFYLRAYDYLITMDRMRERMAFENRVNKLPCSNKKWWALVNLHGIMPLTDQLMASTFQLERAKSRYARSPYEKRMAILHRFSKHVARCPRCTAFREYERKEFIFQDEVYDLI